MGFELRLAIRCEHQIVEGLRVEESRVRLTHIRPKPRLPRKPWNRDQLPHLETNLEVFGNLVQVAPELFCGGRSLGRRIVSHGPKQRLPLILILAILPQTLHRKRVLGYCRL